MFKCNILIGYPFCHVINFSCKINCIVHFSFKNLVIRFNFLKFDE